MNWYTPPDTWHDYMPNPGPDEGHDYQVAVREHGTDRVVAVCSGPDLAMLACCCC